MVPVARQIVGPEGPAVPEVVAVEAPGLVGEELLTKETLEGQRPRAPIAPVAVEAQEAREPLERFQETAVMAFRAQLPGKMCITREGVEVRLLKPQAAQETVPRKEQED